MVKLLWQKHRPPRNAWMMQAERDQNCRSLPEKRILICTSPRTASNSLGYLMLAAGMGLPWEYYGEGRPETLATRWGMPVQRPQSRGFAEQLMRQRSVNGVFGLKLQWSGFKQYITPEVWRKCFSRALVIYLEREDREAQAVSLAVANSTGRWFQNPDAEPLDVPLGTLKQHLVQARQQIEDERAGWEGFFKRENVTPLRWSMEHFIAQPVDCVNHIANLAGADIDQANLEKHSVFAGKYQTDALLKSKLNTRNR